MRIWREGMPESVTREIEAERLQLHFLETAKPPVDAAHIFVKERAELEA
jgi:hypothetical protein